MSYYPDTPEYREAIERQHETSDFVALAWDLDYLDTPERAPVDAMFSRNGVVAMVAEVKCRNMTSDEFRALDYPRSGRGHSGLLIGRQKLVHGASVGAALWVPYVLIVGLYPSREIYTLELFGPGAGWLVNFAVHTVETQRSVDGGRAQRECAFIPIAGARAL